MTIMLVDLTIASIFIFILIPNSNSLRASINLNKISNSCSTDSDIPLVDLITVDIKTLHNDLSACHYSSADLVRWYLNRIEAFNRRGSHPLHAVIETNPDALSIANQLDRERQINGSRSMLHGIPILIKDNIATDDRMETTAGSFALVGSHVPRDAFIVKKLRDAGAIILGKTSLTQWSNFMSENVTRDGWSARGGASSSAYVENGDPSGSSSGSAIATSAGLCAAAIGTETAGSIVLPSDRANIVGLKPTVGLTSRSGVIPISHDHDTVGPMGKSVEDVAILLESIQGVDSRDNATEQSGILRYENYTQFLRGVQGLKHLRLGVVREGMNISGERKERLRQAIDRMRFHGAKIIDPINLTNFKLYNETEDFLPLLRYNFPRDLKTYLSELKNTTIRILKDLINYNLQHENTEFHSKYSPDQKLFLSAENSTNFTASDCQILLNKTRHLYGQNGIDATLNRYRLDALMVPNATHNITYMASLVGYPLIVVPLGFNKSNDEPYGMLFAGTASSEPILLRVAHGFEQAFPIRNTHRPKYAQSQLKTLR